VRGFKYGDGDLARIAKLWAANASTAEIGRRLELSKNTVCRLARDARLSGDPRFPAREFKNLLREPKTARRVGKSKAPPAPILAPFQRRRGPLRVFELEAQHCRYPVSSGLQRDHRFCGKPRQAGSSYCGEHHALCNTGPLARAHLAKRV
jgi:hypothetical protein